MILMHNQIEKFKNNNLIQKYDSDAGYDIRSPHLLKICPGTYETIDTRLHVKLPDYLMAFVKSKSGIGIKLSTECSNSGVIDASYIDSIKVKLYNLNLNDPMIIKPGERFCQLVPLINPKIFFRYISKCRNFQQLIMTFEKFDAEIVEQDISTWSISDTERGQNGLGSTGVK